MEHTRDREYQERVSFRPTSSRAMQLVNDALTDIRNGGNEKSGLSREDQESIFDTSITDSKTMSKDNQRLMEDTVAATNAGTHNAREIAAQQKSHEAQNLNLNHQETLKRGNEAGQREAFDHQQEKNVNKNQLLDEKSRDKLDWNAKKDMNAVGHSASHEQGVKKSVKKAAVKKATEIEKNLGKGASVSTSNVSKVADAAAKGRHTRIEVQVQTATGGKVDVKADAAKGDVQQQVEEKSREQQEKDLKSMSKEDRIRALRGLSPKDQKNAQKSGDKDKDRDKTLEARKDKKRQKIAELRMKREHLGAGR